MSTIEEQRIVNNQAHAMDRSDVQAAAEAIAIKLAKQHCKKEAA